jgi:protein SCO1/2
MLKSTMPSLRFALWAAMATMGAAAFTIYLSRPADNRLSIADYGRGSYELVDQDGAVLDETMFLGHPSMLFFGYTHCPDICPTTMAEMVNWLEEVGAPAESLKAYFVTVDPARDTREVLASYVAWTGGRVTGVTGTAQELERMMSAWQVTADVVPGNGGEYTMDHTASVFLIDAGGSFRGTIAFRENWETAVAKIRRLVGS